MPDIQIIDGITVETGEKHKGCNVLFYSIKATATVNNKELTAAVRTAYRANGVRLFDNPRLEQIIPIAKDVTAAGFPCKVEGWWGFYA